MIHFTCSCGNALFFENSTCLQCGLPVGYDLAGNRFVRLEAEAPFRRCENGTQHGVCNWVIPAASTSALCRSCRLTRTIPNLSEPGHLEAWRRMEADKRRVLYTVARLGLFPMAKSESPEGLAFDFLAPQAEALVLTGHASGDITMNIREADDVYREAERRRLREPYRTLIGHFRHEIGHYYWERFFLPGGTSESRLALFRQWFGDEREDYAAALARHYAQGADPGWAGSHITAYASVHPWEDWAETWAHYLHIVDSTETARAFGWNAEAVRLPFTPFTLEDLHAEPSVAGADFLEVLNTWTKISPAVNEIAASLGQGNLYPFVFNAATAAKILFVHETVLASVNLDAAESPAA